MGLIGYPRRQHGEERCVTRQKRLRARLATSAQHFDGHKIKLVCLLKFLSLIYFLAHIDMYIWAYIFFFNIQSIVMRFWSYLHGKGAL